MNFIKVIFYGCRLSWKRFCTYKSNAVMTTVNHVGIFFVSLLFIRFMEEYFLHQYYTREQIYLLLSIDLIIFKTITALFFTGSVKMANQIHYGCVDAALLHPVSTRLYYFSSNVDFGSLISLMLPVGLFVWTLKSSQSLHIDHILLLKTTAFTFFSIALALAYLLFSVAVTFYFPTAGSLQDLYLHTHFLRLLPLALFPSFFEFFYVWVVPVAYVSKIPYFYLVNTLEQKTTLLFLTSVCLWVLFAELFWRQSKKKYTSAS